MAFTIRVLRSSITGHRPGNSILKPGELYVNFADEQLGVVDDNGMPQDLIGVRIFNVRAGYAADDYVIHDGHIWQALVNIAPGAFDETLWQRADSSLSIIDYDPANEYPGGTVAFFPAYACFFQAIHDIPANTPYDPDMWGPLCNGAGGSGAAVGDILGRFTQFTVDEQTDMRRVLLVGQLLPKTGEYAELFALWGHKFGPGNATHFQIPDMRGRAIRGVDDTAGVDTASLGRVPLLPGATASGAVGGTYQEDEVGPHTHRFVLVQPQNDYTGPHHGYVTNNKRYNFRPAWETYTNDGTETVMKNISVYWYAQY